MSVNSQELVRQYKANDTEIKRLRKTRDEEKKEIEEERREITESYYAKERELNRRQDEAIEVAAARIGKLREAIKKVERIKMFLNTDTSQALDIDDNKVKPKGHWHEDEYFEPLGYLVNDDFLKVKLYIVENKRPKNKYSLEAVGACAFQEKILTFPHSYMLILDTMFLRLPLAHSFKSLPTVEEIKQYLEKGRANIIRLCKGDYDEVKREYLETIANYTLNDFTELEEVSE